MWKRRCSIAVCEFRLQEVGQGPHGDGRTQNLTFVSGVYNCRGGLKATTSSGYKTVTSKGNLLRGVTVERLSPVCTRPYIALCFIYISSRQATRVALQMEHAATLSSPQLVTRARASLCNCTFHLRSTIVTANKTALAR
jgi:hypothetical protein